MPKPPPTGGGAGACDQQWLQASGTNGSLAFNGWLYTGDTAGIAQYRTDLSSAQTAPAMFTKESSIRHTSATPVFADSVWVDLWPWPTDLPNANLYLAGGTENPPELERVITPRHGGVNPALASRNFNPTHTLPGAINMGLSDGHVEGPPLERLWSYYWSATWVVPNPRPK